MIQRMLPASPILAGNGAWTSNGPFGGGIHSMASAPTDPDVLYVGTDGSGIWRSDDGGRTWSELDPEERAIFKLAFDPERAGHLFGLRAALSFFDPARVVESDDGGLTWTELPSPDRR